MQSNVPSPRSPRAGTILLTVREVDPATWNALQQRPEGLQIAQVTLKRGRDDAAPPEGVPEAKRNNRSGPGVSDERDADTLAPERGASRPPHPTEAEGCPDERGSAIESDGKEEIPLEHNHAQEGAPDAPDADPSGADGQGPDASVDQAAMALLDLRYGWLARRAIPAAGNGNPYEAIAEPPSADDRHSIAPLPPDEDSPPRGISRELLRYALKSSGSDIVRISSPTMLKSLLRPRWKRCCLAEGGRCDVCAKRAITAGAGDNDNECSSVMAPELQLPAIVVLSKGKFHKMSKDQASGPPREEKMKRLEGIVKKLWIKKAEPML
ncbi:uncharacterized protein LOC144113207 [Amblyomma americanum]